ncbi:LacI family DNA-binding transcriptional regulator [uncultured Bifidobacterium sp.]|uniref:LacI family DNA-binding transcriptional regulator n=1 Tax=uncultured Bifidobacterium sp. TaxID=165187 RepID=UPI0028DCBB10|nr:LacI family DNA-binding transcriptional regulator [uncultured Bifidobacterium sp.]
MTTMQDIADLAGVSKATVSLVLNHHDAGRVNPETAEFIRRTADKLGYRPNQLARSLRTNRTHMLGFMGEEVATTPFAGGIILGAQDAASAYGYVLLTVSTDGKAKEENETAALKRYGVDGFLYSKMSNRITDIPRYLTDYILVLVNATDRSGRFPSVEPDEFRIGYDATTRLIHAGCLRISYIGCSDPLLAQSGRLRGYHAALADAGMPIDDSLHVDVANNGPALKTVSELFDRQHPDAFFCFNDARAWYVYECAARRGLTIGRDISIVGVDNHRVFAETLEPQLTTIELPHYEMGYWAACRLISMIEGHDIDCSHWPQTNAPMPPLDAPIPATIHCTLIDKGSVRT